MGVAGAPLQPDITSMPMICTNATQGQGKDTLLVVLYGANMELIQELIEIFASNIVQSHREAGDGIAETLQVLKNTASQGLDYARAVLLLLLNVDTIGKRWICTGFPNAKIGSLCGKKAPGFFTSLSTDVVPSWQRNEARNVQQLVADARSAYLVA